MTALAMAGGRGSRMGGHIEKPLLEISGKSMLQRVVEALSSTNSIDRIVVASSNTTPATTTEAKRLGVQTIITPGSGFEEDMRFAIHHLSLNDTLVISCDLPFVTVDIVEKAIRKYRDTRKPALAVMAPAELYEKFGTKPGYVFEIDGKKLVPVGINIIDGRRIDEGTLEQTELIINSEEAVFNVNTPHELDAARKRSQTATERP